jgi:hypothetical protein
MRRLGMILALGVLLGMLGGVVTVAPALAAGPNGSSCQRSPSPWVRTNHFARQRKHQNCRCPWSCSLGTLAL